MSDDERRRATTRDNERRRATTSDDERRHATSDDGRATTSDDTRRRAATNADERRRGKLHMCVCVCVGFLGRSSVQSLVCRVWKGFVQISTREVCEGYNGEVAEAGLSKCHITLEALRFRVSIICVTIRSAFRNRLCGAATGDILAHVTVK